MSTADSWENMAERWDANAGDEDSNWHRALLHPVLLKVLGPLSGRRVLDVGCGNGSVPCTWKLPSGAEVVTQSYHRPLSWYFGAISEAGFVVLGLDEPAPTQEFAQGEAGDSWPDTPFLEQIPPHCILDACKLNGR